MSDLEHEEGGEDDYSQHGSVAADAGRDPEASHQSLASLVKEAVEEIFQSRLEELKKTCRASERSPPRKATKKRSPSPKRSQGFSDSESDEPSKTKKAKVSKQRVATEVEELSSTPSSSDREEGELSEEEELGEGPEPQYMDRLFTMDLFPRVIYKAGKSLDLSSASTEGKPEKSKAKLLFPRGPIKPETVPFPEALEQILEAEWRQPTKSKHTPKAVYKMYNLPDNVMKKLQVPLVDAPVAAISSSSLLPTEGEGGPKDPSDKRTDLQLKRGFEATAQTLRAAAANAIMSRATYTWVEELQASDQRFSKRTRNTLKKIQLSAAFSADASVDAMQLSARALAANVAAKRNVWLHNWNADTSSINKLMGIPFSGHKLFGEALDPLLIEDKDKKKVLPCLKKEQSRKPQSFRPSTSSSYKPRESYQRPKPKWTKPGEFSKAKFTKGPNSGSSKPGKGQRRT